MPGISFYCLLDQAVQVGLAAVPAKAGGICQDTRPPPLITLMAAPLDHPTLQSLLHASFYLFTCSRTQFLVCPACLPSLVYNFNRAFLCVLTQSYLRTVDQTRTLFRVEGI